MLTDSSRTEFLKAGLSTAERAVLLVAMQQRFPLYVEQSADLKIPCVTLTVNVHPMSGFCFEQDTLFIHRSGYISEKWYPSSTVRLK